MAATVVNSEGLRHTLQDDALVASFIADGWVLAEEDAEESEEEEAHVRGRSPRRASDGAE